jgi:hypothetical protein
MSAAAGTLIVNPAPLTITADNKTSTYGSALPALTASYGGFLNGDTSASLTTQPILSTPATAAGHAGSYTISASGAVETNYTISYVAGTLTVNAAPASVTPNAASKIYGVADPVFSGTLSGFLPADGVTATYSRTAGETVAGGPYTISATLAPAGVLDNYNITANTASFTIIKATPTIIWDTPADIVYGTPLGAAQLNAIANGVAGRLNYSPSSGTLLGAGMNQTLLASFTPTDTSDYSSASKTVQINVVKATPSFGNLNSSTIAYGTATVNLTGKISIGSLIPTGSVAITLNGVTQNAAIQADGSFSSNFATASLAPVSPPYSIAYSYGGDSNFNPASSNASLTVVYNVLPLYDQTQAHQSGSTIPIKLEVTNATGNNLSSSNLIVTAVGVSLISSTAYGPVADSGNANPDSNFRFDSSNMYIFNLNSAGLRTGVYNLSFRAGADPTMHTVQFQIR